MKMIELGECGLSASAAVLGCMRISELKASELETLIFSAMDAGINLFDHADIYGGGRCEERFGEFLHLHPNVRDRILLQSKCGIRKGFFDFSLEHILTSVDRSLSRLQTDHLDLLLLHRPDALVEPEEVAEAFSRLHESGKVRCFGVSNHNPGQIELLRKYVPVKLNVNQLQFGPAHTPMIDSGLNVNIRNENGTVRDGGILDYCRLNNITIQSWSPFLFGFFEGVFLASDRYRELNECLERIGKRYHLTPGGAAVAWISRHPAHIQTVIGSTKPQRVLENCRGVDAVLTREEWYEIYRAAGNRLP